MSQRLPTYREFGLRALLLRLNVFQRCTADLREQNDADAVHDLRVASRRFHAAALLFSDTLPPAALTNAERRIRRVRKAAGNVRDGDVQMEFIAALMRKKRARRYRFGLERLLLRLSQRREKQMRRITAALATLERSTATQALLRTIRTGTSRTLRGLPLPLRQRSGQAVAAALAGLFRYEQFVKQSSAAAELHQMRIAAKRLRYVMEIFNPVYKGTLTPYIRIIRTLQDALGQMHDCDVWLAVIPEFIEEERKRTAAYFGDTRSFPRIERGMLFLAEYARTERMRLYRKFTRIWNTAVDNGVWTSLTKVIAPHRRLTSSSSRYRSKSS
jgi:CHAD domain-containing protein